MDLFPAPHLIFRRFAESTIASPLRRKLLLWSLDRFGVTRAAEKSRRRMMALAEQGANPFDLRTVPVGPSGGIYPEFSFSVLFERAHEAIEQRATKLLRAALEYRQALLSRAAGSDVAAGEVLHDSLFGCVANLRKSGLRLTKTLKHCNDSRHVVVAVDGAYYALDVIDNSGAIMPAQRLLQSIKSILAADRRENSRTTAYGAIAASFDRPAADIFFAEELDESIRTIDEAILLLAIDDLKDLADENDAAQDLHIRNYHNRDYRKSLQLVVLKSGFSGATFNLFAGIEGVAATRFSSRIDASARAMPQPIAAADADARFRRLEFRSIDFPALPLARLTGKIAGYVTNHPPIKRVDAIGKDTIKELNVSPDAFFHAAAHLAFYESFKRIPSVHNFIDMRSTKFGSITRYPSTSAELVSFLHNPTKPSLLEAFEAHKNAIRTVRSGDHPLYYALVYFFNSPGIVPELGLILFTLFVPGFITRHLSPDIWASNIPALPGIHCVGRFGTLFKPARKNCLAGNYLLFPDHIRVCFYSREKTFLEAWPFERALNRAVVELRQILS
jgi:hypothetical protein